jgi:hypothetical protein
MTEDPMVPEVSNVDIRDTKTYKITDFIAKVLAPSTLASLVCEVAGIPRYITVVVALTIAVSFAVIFLGRRFFRPLMLIFLIAYCLCASGVLVWQYQKYSKEPWLNWRNTVKGQLAECKAKNDHACIANIISTHASPEGLEASSSMELLERDIRVGKYFLEDDEIAAMLKQEFGVDKKSFLGIGYSLPKGEGGRYTSAKVPEYLTPNLSEQSERVITCKVPLKPENLKRPIKELIGKEFCTNIKSQVSISPELLQDDRLPPVVRFAQLNESSGKLGRPDANRTFASQLRAVWDMPLEEAARNSGFTFDQSAPPKQYYYVWVFIPTDVEEVVPATWAEIFSHVCKWLNCPSK